MYVVLIILKIERIVCIMIDTQEKIKSVYTAHSKHYFYARKMISAYTLEKNYLPLNPFTNWDYFMNDMVDRNLTII